MISIQNVTLGYGSKKILSNLNLQVSESEFIGIIGLSGAGKSTLLSSIIGNVNVFSGNYQVSGFHMDRISKRELKDLRGRIGFIFQGYNLVNRLNALHNIMSGMLRNMPLLRSLIKLYSNRELELVHEYMKVVGIEDIALQRCDTLSGGQRQRVAIARALAQKPEILLADEPVAALDPVSAVQVMDVLKKINQTYRTTIIANLHHLDFARDYCSRILGIAEGKIVFDGLPDELNQDVLNTIYNDQGSEIMAKEEIDLTHLHTAAGRKNIRGKNRKKEKLQHSNREKKAVDQTA